MFSLQLGHTDRIHDLILVSALIADEIDTPLIFEGVEGGLPALDDWAAEERLEASRLSLAGLAGSRADYGVLNCGAVVGSNLGPAVVGRKENLAKDLSEAEIIYSGLSTSFILPLLLYMGNYPQNIKATSGFVVQDLLEGRAEVGIIIAEEMEAAGRAGLETAVDLGAWWKGKTGLPLPLEVFAARRVLGQETAREIDAGMRRSFIYAGSDPAAGLALVRKHRPDWQGFGQGPPADPYLNEFSGDLGPEGREAVEALFEQAQKSGLIPESNLPLWAY